MKARSLQGAIAFYLASRRRLGLAFKSEGARLENRVEYARQLRCRGPLTTEWALNWAQAPPPMSSRRRARRWEAVGHFAFFWATFDPRTPIPPAGLLGPAYRRVPVPIYTPQQIAALLAATQQLPQSESLRSRTFGTLPGLLACTGRRLSEALQWQREDGEPTEAGLTIRQSKFGQSRYGPLAPSATTALKTYRPARTKAFPKSNPSALFLNGQGQPLTCRQARSTFAALRSQPGWQHKRPRPRLPDLRHTFAVDCLLGWHRKGQQELNAKSLSLAVYLGHRNIRHTCWYLTAVPELLALGSARWAKALAGQKAVAPE